MHTSSHAHSHSQAHSPGMTRAPSFFACTPRVFRDGTLIGVYEPTSNLLKMALMIVCGVSPRTIVTANVLLHAAVVMGAVLVGHKLVLHVWRAAAQGLASAQGQSPPPSSSSSAAATMPKVSPPSNMALWMAASAVTFGCHPMRVEAVAW